MLTTGLFSRYDKPYSLNQIAERHNHYLPLNDPDPAIRALAQAARPSFKALGEIEDAIRERLLAEGFSVGKIPAGEGHLIERYAGRNFVGRQLSDGEWVDFQEIGGRRGQQIGAMKERKITTMDEANELGLVAMPYPEAVEHKLMQMHRLIIDKRLEKKILELFPDVKVRIPRVPSSFLAAEKTARRNLINAQSLKKKVIRANSRKTPLQVGGI